jgi:hypothetical protein
MRKALALPLLVLAVAAAPVFGGCTGDSSPAKSSTIATFVSLAASGVNVDYTPLASPQDAVAKADLIVEGTLTDVVDGIGLKYPDPLYTERQADTYATFVITVERVISGDPAKVLSGRVYATVHKSRAAEIDQLAAANPHPRIVAVLDEATHWSPARGVRVNRPAAVPSSAPLYAPYTDGIWLQGPEDAQMYGLHADPDELAASWGRPRTVSQFSAAVQRAA